MLCDMPILSGVSSKHQLRSFTLQLWTSRKTLGGKIIGYFTYHRMILQIPSHGNQVITKNVIWWFWNSQWWKPISNKLHTHTHVIGKSTAWVQELRASCHCHVSPTCFPTPKCLRDVNIVSSPWIIIEWQFNLLYMSSDIFLKSVNISRSG